MFDICEGIGVPLLLAYVYGVVPISLCRSGGCGVSTTDTGGVRIDFDESDVPVETAVSPFAGITLCIFILLFVTITVAKYTLCALHESVFHISVKHYYLQMMQNLILPVFLLCVVFIYVASWSSRNLRPSVFCIVLALYVLCLCGTN